MKTYNLNLTEEQLNAIIYLITEHMEVLNCFIKETEKNSIDFNSKQKMIFNVEKHKEKFKEIFNSLNFVIKNNN